MKLYIVEIIFIRSFDSTFYQLLPSHREAVTEYISEGIIKSYSLSERRDKLWIVFRLSTQEEVAESVYGFPIAAYFLDVKISELMFHETSPTELPQLWLN